MACPAGLKIVNVNAAPRQEVFVLNSSTEYLQINFRVKSGRLFEINSTSEN